MTIKKALLIGLLSATVVGLLAYGIKHKSFSKENLTKTFTRSTIRVNADNEITNLTGTDWQLNESYELSNNFNMPADNPWELNINFTSNNQNFTKLTFATNVGDLHGEIYYNNTLVYERNEDTNPITNTWTAEEYRLISITGGTDATDTDLILWLRQNATRKDTSITITQEVVDIRGLMLTILTMPFSFISQAFNVTLWPGTEYQLNISNFIIAIISIMALLFIIKLFTSGFNILGNYTNSRADTKLKKEKIKTLKANRESKKKE